MKKYTNYKLALKWSWMNKYYDFLIGFFIKEKIFKNLLVNQFKNKHPNNILDIGCGTATLAILIKKKYPNAQVIGLDGDSNILSIANKKIRVQNLNIQTINALSAYTPFNSNLFDIVTCTLMLHHLTDDEKIKTLSEAYRILKPNGEINIADFGKAANIIMRFMYFIVQILDGFKNTQSNVQGKIPDFMKQAGFKAIKETHKINTVAGTIALYIGEK